MFDSYCLNITDESESQSFTEGCRRAKELTIRLVNKFGLTYDNLFNRTGNPKKRINDVSVSEIRKVLSYYFTRKIKGVPETNLSFPDIARIVGARNHTSIIYSMRAALSHYDIKDPKFMYYYQELINVI